MRAPGSFLAFLPGCSTTAHVHSRRERREETNSGERGSKGGETGNKLFYIN